MKIALFPGTFDPFTIGHEDVINCIIDLFDVIIIGVLDNSSKTSKYNVETRTSIVAEAVLEMWSEENLNKIRVTSGKSIVEIAKKVNATCVVRGVRNTIDFENEMNLSRINFEEFQLDTLFVPAPLTTNYISSTFVKEMIKIGRPIDSFVDCVTLQYYQE